MVGSKGEALTELSPDGLIRCQGELWSASAQEVIPAGERVRVVAVDRLHARVVKVNHGVLDRTWVHLRDGSGEGNWSESPPRWIPVPLVCPPRLFRLRIEFSLHTLRKVSRLVSREYWASDVRPSGPSGTSPKRVPVAMVPETFEMVEVRLADDSVREATWVGTRWWTVQGSVQPVAWRPRRRAAGTFP